MVATERAGKKGIFGQDCLGVEHFSAFHGLLPAFEVQHINTLYNVNKKLYKCVISIWG